MSAPRTYHHPDEVARTAAAYNAARERALQYGEECVAGAKWAPFMFCIRVEAVDEEIVVELVRFWMPEELLL